jgi:serine/threonine protein kinase
MEIAEELATIVLKKNGRIDDKTYEVQEFLMMKKYEKPQKITKLCDIYSIGAIIFKLLIGRAPSYKIS